MNKQDTYQVLAMLQAIYPDSFRGMTDSALQLKVSLWQEQFADEPAALVQSAVKAYISTDKKGFMPVPGQIKAQISILRNQGGISESEAWDMVLNALKNSSYNSSEEWAKLPPDIQKAVGSANMLRNWASVSISELHTVVASTFKRAYREIREQAKDLAKIPKAVKELAENAPVNLIEDKA